MLQMIKDVPSTAWQGRKEHFAVCDLPGFAELAKTISVDKRAPEKQYIPGHPDADADGYVSVPRVNPAEDMVDLVTANRSYQANVAAMSAVKDMIQKSIDLLR